jgi:hypothetical protein
MHWQDAVRFSLIGEAIRKTPDGRVMLINEDDYCEIETLHKNGTWRQAHGREYQGYNDWRPVWDRREAGIEI